jgi:hypothetical protein
VLFGVDGLRVTDAEWEPDGTVTVWATDHPTAAACTGCGTVAGRVHDWLMTRPRDVRRGGYLVRVWWVTGHAGVRCSRSRAT